MSKKPEWLDEFRRRTLLIDVIDEAFDPSVDDKTVREHLKEAAQELGELFMPSGPEPGKGAQKPWPKRRR